MKTRKEREALRAKVGLKPGKPVKFAGWICGDEQDREILQELGVSGAMIWKKEDDCRGKGGIFEYCDITLDVAHRLLKEYPAFWPGYFTGVNKKGEQTIDQPLYDLSHEMRRKILGDE